MGCVYHLVKNSVLVFWGIDMKFLRFGIIGLFVIFFLLVFKKVSSLDTLIPNLEPYPDTLYYAVPAWNLVSGRGFTMAYDGWAVKQVTPPLYSLYLIPFFAIFRDVRMFYFANLALIFGAFMIFLLTIKELFGQTTTGRWLILFLGFFFVTNYYVYTIPALLMAEGITLFFFTLALYLMVKPPTSKTVLIASVVGSAFFFIKISNLSVGLMFYLLYAIKLIRSDILNSIKKKYFVFSFLMLVSFGAYMYFSNFLSGHKNLDAGTSFSIDYFQKGFGFYLDALLGKTTTYIWYHIPMLPSLVSWLAISGMIAGMLIKKYRLIAMSIVVQTFVLVIFMSFFNAHDLRYIIMLIPAQLVLAGFAVMYLKDRFGARTSFVFMAIVIIISLAHPSAGLVPGEPAVITYKKQIGLNFKHREVPWNYIAILKFNDFFEKEGGEDVYLGTFLPPFYIHLYSNGRYKHLPITMGQEFFAGTGGLAQAQKIQGIPDYYEKQLKQGKKVYFSNYYVAHSREAWQMEIDALFTKFNVKQVATGCLGGCNIFEVKLK